MKKSGRKRNKIGYFRIATFICLLLFLGLMLTFTIIATAREGEKAVAVGVRMPATGVEEIAVRVLDPATGQEIISKEMRAVAYIDRSLVYDDGGYYCYALRKIPSVLGQRYVAEKLPLRIIREFPDRYMVLNDEFAQPLEYVIVSAVPLADQQRVEVDLAYAPK